MRRPHSLARQSCGDYECKTHESGWGIGYYEGDAPRCERSPRPAHADPRFAELAEAVASPTVLAHIRRASMGAPIVRNCHPFVHGRWMFAHNGTLYGFDAGREQVRAMIPGPLRGCIQGETDSEHAFYLLLARLEEAAPRHSPAAVRRALVETVRLLRDLFPGRGEDRSEFNFVLTDGRLLLASRRGHSLSWLRRQGGNGPPPHRPAADGAGCHAVVVASEPTTDEPWAELPDDSVLSVSPDLQAEISPLG